MQKKMTRLSSEVVAIEALLPGAVFQVMSRVVAYIHPVLLVVVLLVVVVVVLLLLLLLRAARPSALSSTLVAVWQTDRAVVVVDEGTYRQLPQVTVVDSQAS